MWLGCTSRGYRQAHALLKMRQEAMQAAGISAEEAARIYIVAEMNSSSGCRQPSGAGRASGWVEPLDCKESADGRALAQQFRLLIFGRSVECFGVFQRGKLDQDNAAGNRIALERDRLSSPGEKAPVIFRNHRGRSRDIRSIGLRVFDVD